MSVIPTFYLSSRKENPKTNIQFTIKDINENINIDLNSDMELPIIFNDLNYILKLSLKFNISEKDPIIDVNYNFIEQEDTLLEFINNIKNKIETNIEEENKKIEDLEYVTKIKNQRLNEIKDLEESINKITIEKDLLIKEKFKQEEDFKIYKFNQQNKYETNVLLKELVSKVSKLEEDLKIRESFHEDVTDDEHNKLMSELKAKNEQIEKQNEKLIEEENKVEESKTTDIPDKFNQNNIISFLKTELQNIKNDEKQLDTLNENDKEKINELKEKYSEREVERPNLIPKEIVEDPNNLAFNLEGEIYEHLKLIISDDLNMIYTNLIYVITELMKFVETFNMEGFDKKKFIIDSIKKFLIYQKMNSPETDFILDTVCPELIDVLLLVDKRKIIIRKKLNCFIPWCS